MKTNQPDCRRPPRHKLALLTFFGLLAPVYYIPPALAAALPPEVSRFGVVVIAVAIIVVAMMYAISPALTRLFASWLAPPNRPASPSSGDRPGMRG